MTASALHVLDSSGDLTLSWNPASPEETEAARRMVEELHEKGYSFFRVDGSPAAGVVEDGIDVLSCRRIEAAAVVEATDPAPPEPKRRGRPRKQAPPAETPTRTIAVQPLQGG